MDITRIIRVLNDHGVQVVCKGGSYFAIEVYTQHGETFEELVPITENFPVSIFLGY